MKKLLVIIFLVSQLTLHAQKDSEILAIRLAGYTELKVNNLDESEKFYITRFNLVAEKMEDNLHQIKRYLKSKDGFWLILSWGRLKPVEKSELADLILKTDKEEIEKIEGISKKLFPDAIVIIDKEKGIKIIQFRDPDGYLIEIIESVEKIETK